MAEGQHPIIASFGFTNVWRGKGVPRWSKVTRPREMFEESEAFRYAPVEVAIEGIRKDIKSYIQGSYFQDPSTCVVDVSYGTPEPQQWWAYTPPVFEKLEAAITESRRILEIEAEPDEGIEAQYLEATWKRAVKFLRGLAQTFWDENGSPPPTPSISPSVCGSIDLFWELDDLSLLINVPVDPAKPQTFSGRRHDAKSKVSGTLASDDMDLRHLIGWLSGARVSD